jgi:hypothetical protein
MRIDPSDPRAWGASTHTLPLPAFCEYLQATLGCDVTLLGIEPADTSSARLTLPWRRLSSGW